MGMMQIRHMSMGVNEKAMLMLMTVRLTKSVFMRVIMMFIVNVPVLVKQHLILMVVFVGFSENGSCEAEIITSLERRFLKRNGDASPEVSDYREQEETDSAPEIQKTCQYQRRYPLKQYFCDRSTHTEKPG